MAEGEGQPKLTMKQEAFVAAYLGAAHGNATEAARIAGYRQPHSQGPRLLANVEVSARVSNHVAKKYGDADKVLEKLSEIAFAPSFEFIEVIGRDRSGKPTKVKMDLSNQVKSLELLGKFHQLFTDKIDISGDLGVTYELVGVDPEEMV